MSRVFFAGIIILAVATSACGSQAEIVEVTRAVGEVKPTVAVRGTAVVKETVFETVTAAATATPFVPSFVVEGPAADASTPDKEAFVELTESKRAETQSAAPLTAGEIDDNELFQKYLDFIKSYSGPLIYALDVSERHVISVRDSKGLPVLDVNVIAFANGKRVFEGRTTATGQVLIHPRALGLSSGAALTVRLEKNGTINEISFICGQSDHHIVELGLSGRIDGPIELDVLFLIDATGSMEDEINKLKANILQVSAQIDALPSHPAVRFGMVTYRDRGDAYITRVSEFTADVHAFQADLEKVRARGGGDYPESVNEALHRAIWDVAWRADEAVRLIFLVADAPPHLDYEQDFAYDEEMIEAVRRGIKIIPIASSGLDDQGEYIFRQLAQFTLGRFIFLTYQEAGQPNSGPGTDTDHHVDPQDYSVDVLDRLIVRLVTEELAALSDQAIRYGQQ